MTRIVLPRAAALLDRDGVLIEEIGYLSDPRQVRLIAGAAAAVAALNAHLPVVVVTNQAGVARGFYAEECIARVHARLDELLAEEGAKIDAYYYCPHHPEAVVAAYRTDCRCRKPRPGMIERAARELDLDLPQSFVIGDKASDVAAGVAAGSRAILVRTGYGRQTEQSLGAAAGAYTIVDDLPAAAALILNERSAAGTWPPGR